MLLRDAQQVALPVGYALAAAETPLSSVYFPEDGVISVVNALPTGQQVEVAAIGHEGMVGVGVVIGLTQLPFRLEVQVPTSGYRVPAAAFARAFHESEGVRLRTLTHMGRLLVQLGRSATCNRFHSNRQRLCRWLLVLSSKSHRERFEITHEGISHIIGGPRHAVSAALNELRDAGAVVYVRGLVEIVDRSRVIQFACACYTADDRNGDG